MLSGPVVLMVAEHRRSILQKAGPSPRLVRVLADIARACFFCASRWFWWQWGPYARVLVFMVAEHSSNLSSAKLEPCQTLVTTNLSDTKFEPHQN